VELALTVPDHTREGVTIVIIGEDRRGVAAAVRQTEAGLAGPAGTGAVCVTSSPPPAASDHHSGENPRDQGTFVWLH
jgi:hypothetical protein